MAILEESVAANAIVFSFSTSHWNNNVDKKILIANLKHLQAKEYNINKVFIKYIDTYSEKGTEVSLNFKILAKYNQT